MKVNGQLHAPDALPPGKELEIWKTESIYFYGIGGQGSNPGMGKDFLSLRRRVQAWSGAHPDFYPMGIVGSSPGVKRPGR
jgi:hypothetical protein